MYRDTGRQFGRFDNVYLALFTEGIASAVEAGLRIMKGALAANNLRKVREIAWFLTGQSVLEADLAGYVCLLRRKISAQ